MKKEIKPKGDAEKAFWIYCRHCGCEYLEPKSWVLDGGPNETKCPDCGNRLSIY